MHIFDLSSDTIYEIQKYLQTIDKLRIIKTCRHFRKLCKIFEISIVVHDKAILNAIGKIEYNIKKIKFKNELNQEFTKTEIPDSVKYLHLGRRLVYINMYKYI